MPVTNAQLVTDFALTSPDAHVIATNWVNSAKGLKGNALAAADLAEMITDIALDFTMQGAPQLEIDVLDVNWQLLDSGFFDPSDGGTLDRIDINYPNGSRYHWRIFQVSPKADFTVQTYWVPRVVADLMDLHGPFSASRSSRTRAQFLQMCVAKVPYANFYSKQIDLLQPIAALSLPTGKAAVSAIAATTSGPKSVGLSAAASKQLTAKGSGLTAVQRDTASKLIQVADQLSAGHIATCALIFDAIYESDLGSNATSNGAYGGVLGGSVSIFAADLSSLVAMATAALKGGQGYTGMIGLAQKSNDIAYVGSQSAAAIPYDSHGYSTQYESQGWPLSAAVFEAEAIVAAGGGATGAGGVAGAPQESVQQYNFAIGTTQAPHEDYWAGMNRLAQEVNWELVVDGDDIFYDSDVTLCRATVEAVVDRKDETVSDWNYDWDKSRLPTNFQLMLECDPFDFRAADVFLLTSFGPASEGSTISLPGRWLVGEIQRNLGDIISTFTLVQPTKPLKEPAPTVSSNVGSGAGGGAIVGAGGATNPAPGAVWGRLDMGFDGNYGPAGAVAPYNGTIMGIGISGWPGQGVYFAILNDNQGGPDYTRAMYFAEGATPIYPNGTKVKAGQKIGNPVASGGTGAPGNFEIGPAQTANGDCLAKSYGLGSAGARAMVLAFEAWMQTLGASASPNPSNAGAP